MLVLTRRIGETFMIGDEVTITILGKRGNQTRFGVKAPKEIDVHREEIYYELKAQNVKKTDVLKTTQRILDPIRMCLQKQLSTLTVVQPNQPQDNLLATSPGGTPPGKPPTVLVLQPRSTLDINCQSESGSLGAKESRSLGKVGNYESPKKIKKR
jgi:carbon storage regulator